MKKTSFFVKTSLLVGLVLAFATAVFAQKNKRNEAGEVVKSRFFDHIQIELGLNTVPLARAIGNRGGADTLGMSPYWANIALRWRSIGLRGSAGGQYSKRVGFVDGFRDSETITNQTMSYRVGLEYRSRLGQRLALGVAADYVTNLFDQRRVLDSGFDVIERISQRNLSGGGLSLNLQWLVSDRLAIGVESSAYFLTGNGTQGRKFVNFPELNDNLIRQDLQEIALPVALWLQFKL